MKYIDQLLTNKSREFKDKSKSCFYQIRMQYYKKKKKENQGFRESLQNSLSFKKSIMFYSNCQHIIASYLTEFSDRHNSPVFCNSLIKQDWSRNQPFFLPSPLQHSITDLPSVEMFLILRQLTQDRRGVRSSSVNSGTDRFKNALTRHPFILYHQLRSHQHLTPVIYHEGQNAACVHRYCRLYFLSG